MHSCDFSPAPAPDPAHLATGATRALVPVSARPLIEEKAETTTAQASEETLTA